MATLDIPATDPLSFSRVRNFFNSLYPVTGGFAVENLGTTTHRTGDFFAWPTGTSDVFGVEDISYTASTQQSGGQVTGVGTFRQSTRSTIPMTDATMEVDIYVRRLDHSTGSANITARLTNSNESTLTPAGSLDILLSGNVTATQTGLMTIRATVQDGADTDWVNNRVLGIYLFSDDSSRPYTVDVRAVRVSFSGTAFQRPNGSLSQYNRGGGIVPAWPNVGGIALVYPTNSFTLTDSNAADTGWTTATPTLVGATAGWSSSPETTAVVDGQNSLNNTLFNNSGSTVLASAGRIDVDLNITDIMAEGSTTQTQANILARPVTSTAGGSWVGGRGAGAQSFRVQDHQLNMGLNTVTLARTGTFSVENTQGIRLAITETNENFTPFTVEVRAVRISFTNNEFTEINTGISTDRTTVTLSSLRGVDDGEG